MILFVLTEVEVILAKLTSEIKKFNSMKSSSFESTFLHNIQKMFIDILP